MARSEFDQGLLCETERIGYRNSQLDTLSQSCVRRKMMLRLVDRIRRLEYEHSEKRGSRFELSPLGMFLQLRKCWIEQTIESCSAAWRYRETL